MSSPNYLLKKIKAFRFLGRDTLKILESTQVKLLYVKSIKLHIVRKFDFKSYA